MRYAGLGVEILACIFIFVGIGYWLDDKYQTEKPWFLLIFALLGCVVALWLMIRTILPSNKS